MKNHVYTGIQSEQRISERREKSQLKKSQGKGKNPGEKEVGVSQRNETFDRKSDLENEAR